VIAAINKRGTDDTFSADDQRLAEAFAARVAVALCLAAGGGQLGNQTPVEDQAEAARAGLTSREIEVLRLVAYGMSDQQVAAKLVVRRAHCPLPSSIHLSQVRGRLAKRRGPLGRRAPSRLAASSEGANRDGESPFDLGAAALPFEESRGPSALPPEQCCRQYRQRLAPKM
jgi:hypothetical protein